MRLAVTGATKKQFKTLQIPVDRMDPFITWFVQRFVRLMLVIGLHSQEFKDFRNKYPPDYIFIAAIIFMRNGGLKIGEVDVLEHNVFLANFMITTNLLGKFGFRQDYTTNCSTAIRVALDKFDVPLKEVCFEATPDDWQLWNKHAIMMRNSRRKTPGQGANDVDDIYEDVMDDD